MDDEDFSAEVVDEGVVDATVEDVTEAETPPSVEDLAGEMGWRPQDQWKGDPDKWKPAHEFMRATVDVNHKLGNRLKGLEDQIGHMARTSATVTERALAKQRDDLLSKRDEAFETGDREAFARADRELAELPNLPPAPELQSFAERNAGWLHKNPEATNWATARCGELAKQGLSEARQLAIVEKEMRETYFPDLFPEPVKEPPKAKPAPLTQPGNRGGAPVTKGFSALPADVQKEALAYEKRGICPRDEYAAIYFEDNA